MGYSSSLYLCSIEKKILCCQYFWNKNCVFLYSESLIGAERLYYAARFRNGDFSQLIPGRRYEDNTYLSARWANLRPWWLREERKYNGRHQRLDVRALFIWFNRASLSISFFSLLIFFIVKIAVFPLLAFNFSKYFIPIALADETSSKEQM